MGIRENVRRLLREIPEDVILVAAAKTRTPQEVLEAVEAGIKVIGENYVQEAERAFELVGKKAIQTVDSFDIAREIDKRCAQIGKVMSVLCEVNIADERTKWGVKAEEAEGRGG